MMSDKEPQPLVVARAIETLLCPARAALSGAAALFLAACGGENPGQRGQNGPTPVQTASPVRKEVTLWDEYVGRFQAVDRVEVRPRVSGYLEEVHFPDGAPVETGDLLFTIDRRPFEAALAGAKARLTAAETSQRLARAELARAEKLLDARAGSEEDYDRRLQAKQAADADVEAAKAAVQQAELDLEFTQIKSPIAGRASRDFVNRGNLVSAQETLLTSIVSMDPIHFVFTASERDYLNYLRLNESGARKSSRDVANPVRIKLEDQDEFKVDGRMNFVDNAINPTTGTIEGQAIVDNPDNFLTPGMFGRMRLFGRDPFEATLIPDRVVQFDQSRQFVWVVGDDDTAQMRPVELGRLVEDDMRIVEEGLAAEDQVIMSGFASLRPGAPVQPSPMERSEDPGAQAAASAAGGL